MRGVKKSHNSGQVKNGGRGNGQNGGRGDKCWTLETDFEEEGSGYQRQQRKRKRRSTGGTVSENNVDPITKTNDYSNLTADDKLTLILSKVSLNEKRMGVLQNKFDTAFGTNGRIAKLEKQVEAQIDRITALEYRSIDLEARSRRNNLLFKGFPESLHENCEGVIRHFLSNTLHISEAIPIQRAHRLGRVHDGQKRFIIVAFTNFQDTEKILRQSYRLKGTTFAISRDFPLEISTARKALWPQFRDLRSQHRGDRVSIVYPAKLVHNGRIVNDMFPNWDTALQRRRISQDEHVTRANHGTRDISPDLHVSVYNNSTEMSSAESHSEPDSELEMEVMSDIEEDSDQQGDTVLPQSQVTIQIESQVTVEPESQATVEPESQAQVQVTVEPESQATVQATAQPESQASVQATVQPDTRAPSRDSSSETQHSVLHINLNGPEHPTFESSQVPQNAQSGTTRILSQDSKSPSSSSSTK